MNIAVIGSYPEKGTIHSPSIVGGAAYTKQLVRSIHAQSPDWNITVFGEQLPTETLGYTEDGVHVQRVWKRNSFNRIFVLAKELAKLQPHRILFSFEAYMFGSMLVTAWALLSLFWLRMTSKAKIVTIVHQVVSSSNIFLIILSTIAYWLVSLASNQMVVFEQDLVTNLKRKTKRAVRWIPLVTSEVTPLSRAEARKKLGWDKDARYFLYFGFLAEYKGIDWLVKAWPSDSEGRSENSHNRLVVAGGQNPNHRTNNNVTKFVTNVINTAKSKGMLVTGVIAEEDVPLYFSAADCLILPYTLFFSSSGPLSLACAYGLPFIVSRPLEKYFESPDIRNAFEEKNIDPLSITFDFTSESLIKATTYSVNHAAELREVCHTIADMRSFIRVAQQFIETIENA